MLKFVVPSLGNFFQTFAKITLATPPWVIFHTALPDAIPHHKLIDCYLMC